MFGELVEGDEVFITLKPESCEITKIKIKRFDHFSGFSVMILDDGHIVRLHDIDLSKSLFATVNCEIYSTNAQEIIKTLLKHLNKRKTETIMKINHLKKSKGKYGC